MGSPDSDIEKEDISFNKNDISLGGESFIANLIDISVNQDLDCDTRSLMSQVNVQATDGSKPSRYFGNRVDNLGEIKNECIFSKITNVNTDGHLDPSEIVVVTDDGTKFTRREMQQVRKVQNRWRQFLFRKLTLKIVRQQIQFKKDLKRADDSRSLRQSQMGSSMGRASLFSMTSNVDRRQSLNKIMNFPDKNAMLNYKNNYATTGRDSLEFPTNNFMSNTSITMNQQSTNFKGIKRPDDRSDPNQFASVVRPDRINNKRPLKTSKQSQILDQTGLKGFDCGGNRGSGSSKKRRETVSGKYNPEGNLDDNKVDIKRKSNQTTIVPSDRPNIARASTAGDKNVFSSRLTKEKSSAKNIQTEKSKSKKDMDVKDRLNKFLKW